MKNMVVDTMIIIGVSSMLIAGVTNICSNHMKKNLYLGMLQNCTRIINEYKDKTVGSEIENYLEDEIVSVVDSNLVASK